MWWSIEQEELTLQELTKMRWNMIFKEIGISFVFTYFHIISNWGKERGNYEKTEKIVWPDYENCIANLPNSILKKWKIKAVGGTLSLADKYLQKDYKNGCHLAGIYKSVFLSTTVAATTSAMSGLQPCEHGWLGWDCYYPQVDKNVTVFLNTVQGTEVYVKSRTENISMHIGISQMDCCTVMDVVRKL